MTTENIDQVEESDELYEHHSFVADPNQSPIRIDKFITDRVANATRNKVQAAIESGCIMVDDEVIIKSSYKVQPGNKIVISLPQPPRETDIVPENIPLNIVYEDDDLLIVNKAPGMVVHPAYENWSGTLVNALVYHFQNLPKSKNSEGRPGLVHRIDKDTSGLLVIAKNDLSMAFLAKQFFKHNLERRYWALVWGVPEQKEGTIDTLLGRSQKDRRVVAVYDADKSEYGKQAITHYKVIEDLGYVSLIECKLETGRTHQIRAHMKHIGHPIFNDTTYGGDKILKGTIFTKYKQFVENAFLLCPRQALHAKTLGFLHPTTKKLISFETELPKDFADVLDKWRNYTKKD